MNICSAKSIAQSLIRTEGAMNRADDDSVSNMNQSFKMVDTERLVLAATAVQPVNCE